MSWSDRLRRGATRRAALGATLAASLSLSGCFTPMYQSLHGELGAEMRAIAVDPVPERLGHYLTDALLTDLNGTGSQPPPKYRLTLTTKERVQTALIDITTRRATNATVVIDTDFVLVPIAGGDPIARGTVTGSASYDRSEQRYANIRAARDAEIRNAKTLADEITQRIAAALSTRG